MPKSYKPIDLTKLQTYSLSERPSKVTVADFAKTWEKGAGFSKFLGSLPDILAGRDIREVISALATAFERGKTIVFGMGAHVIKVGLGPIIIDLMERGIISGVALNGAGIIHDTEIALSGKTSEEVATALEDGSFGMSHDTSSFINSAIAQGKKNNDGLGKSIGRAIMENDLPFAHQSIIAACFRLGIPCTVHVAIGTDIIHMHPEFDPEAVGRASHLDFRLFTALIADLQEGVYVNVGSAVILPEVFLKAVTVARNLGHPLDNITTVNLDFIRHYRPTTNVVMRPTARGGHGFNLTGHHEILIPLLAAGVIETIKIPTKDI